MPRRLVLVAAVALALAGVGGAALAAPAQPPAAAPTPAAAPPPEAAAAVAVLEKACLPLITGEPVRAAAAAAGLRRIHDVWTLQIDRDRRVEVTPPDPSNPHLCTEVIVHDPGAAESIRQQIDRWARTRTPALTAVKVDASSVGPLHRRTTSTWQGQSPQGLIGVALSEEETLSGAPADGAYARSTLLISLTPNGT